MVGRNKVKGFNKRSRKTKLIRSCNELVDIINFVRATAILEGKSVPRVSDITKVISQDIDKEKLLKNVFIQF